MKTGFRSVACVALVAALGACEPVGLSTPDLGALSEPDIVTTEGNPPPGADPNTCWGKHVTPAVIETVTEQVLVQPAEVLADGTVVSQAVYRSETQQKIVQERREIWFETLCRRELTPEFVGSLQRALAARGHYRGSITKEMDAATRAAIRRYQKPEGLDSGIIARETAKRFGLVAADRAE